MKHLRNVIQDPFSCRSDCFGQAEKKDNFQYQRQSLWNHKIRNLTRSRSGLMREIFSQIESVAPTKATVLLVGETGTGKSLMARLIHLQSGRDKGPFVPVHCGSMPETLVESELFGHEKGSFTGAEQRRLGKFELAHQGTILLDEIGTMPLQAQIKLLQVLQEDSFYRVGGQGNISVDLRVVAASNSDLKEQVKQGSFRPDLLHRLNVFTITMPPLRHRLEDIAILTAALLARLEQKYGKGIAGVEDSVLQSFLNYSWPGNIRELENVLERLYILEKGVKLSLKNLPSEFKAKRDPEEVADCYSDLPLSEARRRAVEQFEKRYLVGLLARHKGQFELCAHEAAVTTRQLQKLMTKHKLSRRDFH